MYKRSFVAEEGKMFRVDRFLGKEKVLLSGTKTREVGAKEKV